MSLRRYINLIPNRFIFLKSWNLIKYLIFSKLKVKTSNFLPISMDIEPTTGCNFRCTMCQVSDSDFVARNMNFETFKKVIEENPQLIKIKLQGMGEPLVNKYLFDMIGYARSFGIASEIITNGSLLNERNINSLIKSRLSKIIISIDGASKKTFESIRVKSNFETVVENSRKLISISKKNFLRPEISAWCTVQKENYNEVNDIAKLCRELGFDNLTYQLHLTDWGKEKWNKINSSKKVQQDTQTEFNFLELQKNEKKKNFNVNIFKENLLTYQNQCKWPWKSSYISAEGFVVPCCILGDSSVISLGDIKKNNFREIWNSKYYQEFRSRIKTNNLSDYCKNCYAEHRNK